MQAIGARPTNNSMASTEVSRAAAAAATTKEVVVEVDGASKIKISKAEANGRCDSCDSRSISARIPA